MFRLRYFLCLASFSVFPNSSLSLSFLDHQMYPITYKIASASQSFSSKLSSSSNMSKLRSALNFPFSAASSVAATQDKGTNAKTVVADKSKRSIYSTTVP